MDHQYVDMYLRKKKGYTGSTHHGIATDAPLDDPPVTRSAPAAANINTSGVDRQVDRVVRGSFSVQQFVDRTDALSLQVETFEDKIINLTKLVKLSQALSEEKENDLRKQNHELKARLKRQEQITAKVSADLDHLKAHLPSMIRDSVISITNPIVDDLRMFSKSSQDGLAEQQERLAAMKDTLTDTVLQQSDNLMSKKLAQLQETSLQTLHQQTTRMQANVEQFEKRLENVEGARLTELRRALEDRLTSVVHTARETTLSEMKSTLHLHLDKMHDEYAQSQTQNENLKLRVSSIERQSASLDTAFSDFLATFKDSTKLHADKTEELSGSVREFVHLHEQTRNVVEAELESTKQWATRNLHRLKKHIDVLNSDLVALRESHVETSSQLQRVKCHAEAEHEKLLALLSQKSREANILTEIVDKEIQSIHQLTTQHRSHGASATTNSTSTVHGGGVTAAAVNTFFPEGLDRQRTAGGNLYDELAFTRRPAGNQ